MAETNSNFDTGKEISVVSREDGSGTRGAFVELFGILEKTDAGQKDRTTKEAVITKQTDVMMTAVAGDPYAIGYISLGSLNETVKALDIDGAQATAENVKNGSYAVSRPFYLATKGEASELSQDFMGYILSQEGQALIQNNHYIAIDEAAAAYAGSRPAGKIVVAGSSSVTPVMEKLKEAYLAVNPDAVIEIQQSDSSAGMNAALEGTADIGMASRELKDSEKAELTPVAIALDGIAVIVNQANPVTNLTKDQVKSVFTGETLNWSDLI
ncbi:MAG: substrate-binding domain-containing protein [Candidatus Limiplasma sp.]|nr:substrate-binding domain-containing protein [Candidatus Limiplasma sp.]